MKSPSPILGQNRRAAEPSYAACQPKGAPCDRRRVDVNLESVDRIGGARRGDHFDKARWRLFAVEAKGRSLGVPQSLLFGDLTDVAFHLNRFEVVKRSDEQGFELWNGLGALDDPFAQVHGGDRRQLELEEAAATSVMGKDALEVRL